MKDSFIQRSKIKHNNKFDYSLVDYKNMNTKVKIICPEHGIFEQKPRIHLIAKNCPKCSGVYRYTIDEIVDRMIQVHDDKYDYSLINSTKTHDKIDIICPDHGIFSQEIMSHIKGCGCPSCGDRPSIDTNSFIRRSKIKHNNKFDYSLVDYKNMNTKVKIICSEHGIFEQTPKNHLNSKGGCLTCSLTKDNEYFISKSNIIHNNKFDYSLVEYKYAKSKVKIICRKHGIFEQMPNSHLSGQGCPKCVSCVSNAELEINKIINLSTIQSDRSVIAPLELDIHIPDKKLAIEYNGLYWHSEQKGKDRKYHLNKTEQCESRGIQLIHIFEDEWIFKPKIVRSRLRNLTGQIHRRVHGRKCQVREIDTKTKGKFLDRYHIQGNDKSRVKLGLYYKERLVAVMTFGKSRYSKKMEWELIRYCTISNFRITGGAGKLLKHFEREYKPKSLVSYADRRWSQGKVYKALGFEHSHNSTPNYFYLDETLHRSSRVKFQKHKLKDKLETFNESKTEYQNMLDNGIDRIWDCGNMVFIKEY